MADSYTTNLSLRMPEVGAAHDSWGGAAGLNGDLQLIDAVFLATGLGTSVGLHVGVGKVANVEGTLLVADSTDTTAGFKFDASDITTATIRTLKAPDASGTIALTSEIAVLVPTGSIVQGIWTAAPAGYVLADGRTIGSASSGATNRANADCAALFSLLWTAMPTLPIFTSGGGAATRGANAAADFAANKRLTMFDARGRTLAGKDNMGGTAAGVLPGYTTMGQAGGAATHALTAGELAVHSHNAVSGGLFVVSNVGPNYGYTAGSGNYVGTDGATADTGNGTAHNNIQPTVVINVAVKL